MRTRSFRPRAWRLAGAGGRPTALLAELDFRTVATSFKGANLAAVTAFCGLAPTRYYRLTEAAGAFADGADGTQDLSVFTGATGFLRARTMLGLSSDGTTFQGQTGFEVSNVGGVAQIGASVNNNAFLDIGASGVGGSFVIGIQFRAAPNTTQATLLRKRATAAGTGNGWQVQIEGYATGGRLIIQADDGPTQLVVTGTAGQNMRDGAWHWAFLRVSRSLDEIRIITRYDSVATSIAALGTLTAAASPFGFGFSTGLTNGQPPEDSQVNQIIVWEGANADAFTQAEARLFDTQGADPSGQLTTYTRATTISEIVGYEAGHGLLVTDYSGLSGGGAGPQVASGYDASFAHASRLGIDIYAGFTNLVFDADVFTAGTWAKVSVGASGVNANLADSPRKIREAQRLTATAANGTIEDSIPTAASTLYTQYLFLRSAAGQGNQPCRLIQRNITAGADNAFTDIVVTEEWQLFALSAVTAVGQVTTGFRLRIDNNGAILHAWRACFKAGDLGPGLFTTGAAAASAAVDARATGAAGALVKGARGQVLGLTACRVQNAAVARSIVDAARAADDVDRRHIYYTAAEVPTGDIYTSGGALDHSIAAPAADPSLELEVNLRYKAAGPIPGTGGFRSVLEVNGVPANGSAVNFAATDLATTLYLGQTKANAQKLEGLLALVQTYDGPGPPP